MNTINTKFGCFDVTDNGGNGCCLFMDGKKICEFPKIGWWDRDKIEIALSEHEDVVRERIKERVKIIDVSNENVEEVLEELIRFFGNEQKNFYYARLSQCLAKYKEKKK